MSPEKYCDLRRPEYSVTPLTFYGHAFKERHTPSACNNPHFSLSN